MTDVANGFHGECGLLSSQHLAKLRDSQFQGWYLTFMKVKSLLGVGMGKDCKAENGPQKPGLNSSLLSFLCSQAYLIVKWALSGIKGINTLNP